MDFNARRFQRPSPSYASPSQCHAAQVLSYMVPIFLLQNQLTDLVLGYTIPFLLDYYFHLSHYNALVAPSV